MGAQVPYLRIETRLGGISSPLPNDFLACFKRHRGVSIQKSQEFNAPLALFILFFFFMRENSVDPTPSPTSHQARKYSELLVKWKWLHVVKARTHLGLRPIVRTKIPEKKGVGHLSTPPKRTLRSEGLDSRKGLF